MSQKMARKNSHHEPKSKTAAKCESVLRHFFIPLYITKCLLYRVGSSVFLAIHASCKLFQHPFLELDLRETSKKKSADRTRSAPVSFLRPVIPNDIFLFSLTALRRSKKPEEVTNYLQAI